MADALQGLLQFVDANQPASEPRSTEVADLLDGRRLLRVLSNVSPGDFDDVDLRAEVGDNWVMQRGNLNKVLDAGAAFAVKYLDAADESSATAGIDVNLIAREKDAAAAVELLRFVATVSLLGGGSECVGRVKKLDKAVQQEISNAVKKYAKDHGLKKRKGDLNAKSSTSPTPTASPATAEPPSGAGHSGVSDRAGSGVTGGSGAGNDDMYTELLLKKNELADNLSVAEEAKAKLQDELKDVKYEFERLREQYQQQLQASAASESVATQKLKDAVAAKDSQIASMKKEAAAAKEAADRDREAAQRKIAELEAAVKDGKAQLDTTKEELRRTATDLKFAKDVTNAHASSKGSLEEHVNRVERDLEQAEQRANNALAGKAASDAEAARLKEELAAAAKRVDDLEVEVDMLHRHQAAPPAPASASLDDASPPPKAKDADHERVEALEAEVAELKQRNAAILSDKESVQRHLNAALAKQSAGPSTHVDPSATAEVRQELESARQQLDSVREELTMAEDRYRGHVASLSAMLFQTAQRNVALALELHKVTERVPRLFPDEDMYAPPDEEAEPMDFIARTRRQLEMGPLLEVA
uniref:HOOK N-terminal domain-containing protein n=1 Tax=Neobodo designis TaxID=312471 RepID=A0A7S1Q7W0_NEODS|mmetsp:Transcript_34112/g.105426  ORF Transcript_34112/g.105426 Transcript_34112/m.105426 type:complete len:587 (+) Transcript_34112:85-1845(+)